MIQVTDAGGMAPMSPELRAEAGAKAKAGTTTLPLAGVKRVSRSPKRITITIPYETYQRLVWRSEQEGRSLSNLSAFLLESCLGRSNAE